MTYLYCINLLKKYLFGLAVATYLLSAVGIPIYLHYCGGELEKINVVIKSESCCGGEEDDTQTGDCCKDENVFIQNTIDFTFKQGFHGAFIKSCSQLFYLPLPFTAAAQAELNSLAVQCLELPPPRLQNSLLISTSVLRV